MSENSLDLDDQRYVLIVEDEEDLKQIVKIHVEGLGYLVKEASDGLEALDILEAEPVDVVLSDMIMPKMNGMELLQEIRARGAHIPFIVLSGYTDKDLVVECMRFGIFDYIEKPFDISSLKVVVKEAVRVAGEEQKINGGRELLCSIEDSSKHGDSGKIQRDERAVRRLASLSSAKGEKKAKASEQEPLESLSKREKLIRTFAAEAENQLLNSEKAIRSLSYDKSSSWEMGYIYRVMSSIEQAASVIKEDGIVKLSSCINKCFSLYRIRTSKLNTKELNLLKKAHKLLLLKVRSITDEAIDNVYLNKEISRIINELNDCLNA